MEKQIVVYDQKGKGDEEESRCLSKPPTQEDHPYVPCPTGDDPRAILFAGGMINL
jgi:hypothetical protein